MVSEVGRSQSSQATGYGLQAADRKALCHFSRRCLEPVVYAIAVYASVQKSVTKFGGSGESTIR
jgi:hypothetical protein